jgi:cbb3-type cytochrome oxidase maturation protein
MEIVFVLVPIGIAFAAAVVGVLVWAVKSGQFDDLEGPAHRILLDEEEVVASAADPTADGARTRTSGPA